jgi:hypothetical protein
LANDFSFQPTISLYCSAPFSSPRQAFSIFQDQSAFLSILPMGEKVNEEENEEVDWLDWL